MTTSYIPPSTSSATSWTAHEDALLRDNYTLPWPDLVALLPGRSQTAIQIRMSIKRLKRPRPRHHLAWSDEDVAYLHANFGKLSNEIVCAHLKRKEHAVTEYARRQGLYLPEDENGRTVNTVDGPTLLPLIEGGLQGYYWMGYLMADGYMHHGLKQVVLVSAEADKDHMATYAAFLKTKCHRYMSLDGFKPHSRVRRPTYRISVADTVNALKLIAMYDWKPRKTYNPPSSRVLAKTLADPDAFLAFLIGFIDGDGHIAPKGFGVRVENHASWITFHDFVLDMLRCFGILDTDARAKINGAGYSDFGLPKRVTLQLKAFITKHNLVVLTRKWAKVGT